MTETDVTNALATGVEKLGQSAASEATSAMTNAMKDVAASGIDFAQTRIEQIAGDSMSLFVAPRGGQSSGPSR